MTERPNMRTVQSENRQMTPQIAALAELTQSLWERMANLNPGRETQDLMFISGFNAAVGEAIAIARAEEVRVRNFIHTQDGTCLDSEKERVQLIDRLYGAGDNTD
jgi:hypothetical protein